MNCSFRRTLAILAMLSAPGMVYAGSSLDSYPSIKDTYLDGKDHKDSNFGNSATLTISKDLKSTALLGFNLDNTFNFPTNDCNLTKDISKAELILNVVSATDCQGGECQLELRTTDDFSEGNGSSGSGPTWHCESDSDISNANKDCSASWSGGNIGPKVVDNVTVPSGFSGELKIPITSYVQDLDSGTLVSNLILVSKNHGDVVISSKEGASAPRVEITGPDLKDNESEIPQISRHNIEVNGINTSYLEAGDPNSPNQFLLIHGIPSYSYMYRNVMPRLAAQGHVVAYDWVGTGFSEKAPLAEFDYHFDTQASQLADFVSAMGLTNGGRKLIMVIHEVGGMGAFHYATTHQSDIKGIAFMETWIDLCPPGQEGIACSKDGLVFTPDMMAAWQYVVYPDTSLQYPGTNPWTGACSLIRNYATPAALRYGVTVRGISDQVILNYEQPFACQYDLNNPTDASCPNDPICDLDFSIAQFPRNIPVQVPGEPAYSRAIYDNYVAAMKAWNIPTMLAYGDPGAVVNNIGMVLYGETAYPDLTASCVGKSGHFTAEDAPINLARRIIEWAGSEGILE